MVKEKFNPLTDSVKPASRQSFDLAPDPVETKPLDTTTPALPPKEPRRFELGDLPRYADVLYPVLKKLYPHIHERMYPGWIRGCISDNSYLFLCIDAPDGAPGAAGMGFIAHDPLDPVPYVGVLFVIGDPAIRPHFYKKVVQWARDLGAKDVRNILNDDVFKEACEGVEEQTQLVLRLG